MNVDLHTHTHYSDGKHDVRFLLAEAAANGVTDLAITDHDCVHAFTTPLDIPAGINLIPGVEISSLWRRSEIHVVGLCLNPADEALIDLLHRQQYSRRTRVEQMSAKLQALGTPGLAQHLQTLPSIAWSRSHVADFLVANHVGKSRQKVFKSHLARKGKIWVQPTWCELAEAVSTINRASGISVLAHAGRYDMNKRVLEQLVQDFAAAGGDAIEVSYPNIDPNTRKRLIELATANRLRFSVGSDFHDAAATWSRIGKFQSLTTSELTHAVWHHPNWCTTADLHH